MSAGDILHHGITDPQVERLLEVRVFVVTCGDVQNKKRAPYVLTRFKALGDTKKIITFCKTMYTKQMNMVLYEQNVEGRLKSNKHGNT